jgi:hypothetical protein
MLRPGPNDSKKRDEFYILPEYLGGKAFSNCCQGDFFIDIKHLFRGDNAIK